MLFPAHNPTRPQTFLVRSGSKRVPWCAVVLLLLMIATAAEDRETCQKAEGQAAVAACTAVISSGQLQGHDLAAAYFSRAFNLNKLGEADRAIDDYSEAIRLDPKYVVALNNRCAVYNAKHEYDRAIHDCEQALQLNPNYANAYLGRANALRNKGAYDQAIKDYEQVIRLDPKTAGGFFGRALTLGAKGEYDRAIQDYSIVIERNPRDQVALNNRGVLYEKIRNYDRAIRDFDGAIALNAKYDLAFANRCLTLNRKRDFDRAIEDCNRAIELNPRYATAYVTRGQAIKAKGTTRAPSRTSTARSSSIPAPPTPSTDALSVTILSAIPPARSQTTAKSSSSIRNRSALGTVAAGRAPWSVTSKRRLKIAIAR
jgi:tetratricopeptide (TPR) repeat protein